MTSSRPCFCTTTLPHTFALLRCGGVAPSGLIREKGDLNRARKRTRLTKCHTSGMRYGGRFSLCETGCDDRCSPHPVRFAHRMWLGSGYAGLRHLRCLMWWVREVCVTRCLSDTLGRSLFTGHTLRCTRLMFFEMPFRHFLHPIVFDEVEGVVMCSRSAA